MFKGIMTRLGYEKRADSSYTDALVAVLTKRRGWHVNGLCRLPRPRWNHAPA